MADISICTDVHCPSKDYCHRFTAIPGEFMQSYGSFGRESDADNCDMFWKNGKDSEKCNNVHSEGATCSSKECTYPNCVK